jgi:hypothetical protein
VGADWPYRSKCHAPLKFGAACLAALDPGSTPTEYFLLGVGPMVLTCTADHQPPVAGGYRGGSGSPGAEPVESAGFAQLAVVLYDAAGTAETVDLVLEYALRATGCDCAGVVVVRHGKGLQTAGVTDGRVGQADRLQLSYGEGPCVPVSREHHSLQKRPAGAPKRRLTKPHRCSGVGSVRRPTARSGP